MKQKLSRKKKYWLALGWWAARWFAHIGVIKFLIENNILISEISWTSMGALVGACFWVGMNYDDMYKLVSEINYFKLIDLDFRRWVLKWNKIKDKLRQIFRQTKIQDCKIPLKIVATDVDKGEKIVFEKGDLLDVLRASISVPAILAPYEYDGMNLVDWGIVNNLPIELLKSSDVIAVSALRNTNVAIKKNKNILWFEFFSWFWWYNYRVIQRSIDLMMKQNQERSLSVRKNIVLIQPIFEHIDYYEFHKYDQIIDIGYSASKEQVIVY